MRRGRPSAIAALAAAAWLAPISLEAQTDPMQRALSLESDERYAEAATAFRVALRRESDLVGAVLGLERVYHQLGLVDSLLPVLDTVIAARPREGALRTAQLRSHLTLGDRPSADAAFERWRRDWRGHPSPYREYARLLLQGGETVRADSVLQRAQADLGGRAGLDLEMAQLRAAMGLWALSAESWRAAASRDPHLDRPAHHALRGTPPEQRDSVRAALLAPPVDAAARRILATLELTWGSPRAAWSALRSLPPDPSTLAAWESFATSAEHMEAWTEAKSALAALHRASPSAEIAARGAMAAMSAGDAAEAARLSQAAAAGLDTASVAARILPVWVRALGDAHRAADAERLVRAYARHLTTYEREHLASLLVRAWVRSGDVARARALLPGASEDSEVTGWLALFEGDLATARRSLARRRDASPDALLASTLLSRTRADSSVTIGRGFVALARGDSATAASELERAARSIPDARTLLLAAAARIHHARGAGEKSVALWRQVAEESPSSPEAPEALLEWARALRREGNTSAAVERLEHLILGYPRSALLPQARRELDLARAAVPPAARR